MLCKESPNQVKPTWGPPLFSPIPLSFFLKLRFHLAPFQTIPSPLSFSSPCFSFLFLSFLSPPLPLYFPFFFLSVAAFSPFYCSPCRLFLPSRDPTSVLPFSCGNFPRCRGLSPPPHLPSPPVSLFSFSTSTPRKFQPPHQLRRYLSRTVVSSHLGIFSPPRSPSPSSRVSPPSLQEASGAPSPRRGPGTDRPGSASGARRKGPRRRRPWSGGSWTETTDLPSCGRRDSTQSGNAAAREVSNASSRC